MQYPRLFDPRSDPSTRDIQCNQLTDIIVYDESRHISQLWIVTQAQPQRPVPDESSVVIRIDGACRGNGMPNARASVGVYFGPDSYYNSKGTLPPSIQTSNRAEIEAFYHALYILQRITREDPNLRRIKIVTDSEYLVNAMVLGIYTWAANGGIRPNGEEVVDFERLKELHDHLIQMENRGFWIQFWHVPRELNREADRLANDALDEAEAAQSAYVAQSRQPAGPVGYSGYADMGSYRR